MWFGSDKREVGYIFDACLLSDALMTYQLVEGPLLMSRRADAMCNSGQSDSSHSFCFVLFLLGGGGGVGCCCFFFFGGGGRGEGREGI